MVIAYLALVLFLAAKCVIMIKDARNVNLATFYSIISANIVQFIFRAAAGANLRIFAYYVIHFISSTRIINAVNVQILWRDAVCARIKIPVRSVKLSSTY